MATETLYIGALDVNSLIGWTDAANAIGNENDNYAYTDDYVDLAYAGGNLQNTTYAPDENSTDITYCGVRHFDVNSEHADDTFYLEVYNSHTSTWEQPIPPYSSSSLLPTSLTTNNITAWIQSKYGAASDKRAFIDGLQFRLRMVKTKASDAVNWGLAFVKLTYNYTPVESVTKSFTADAILQKSQTKVVTVDAYVALGKTAYIDTAGQNVADDSDTPASNILATDSECSVEGPQGMILYEDGSDPGWELCFEIVSGGTGTIAEGLGMEDNYGPAPCFPPNGDAKKYFGTTVNFSQIMYVEGADGTGWENRFSQLDPTKQYTITLCGIRGNFYPRWTEFKITVGDGWTAEHSSGTEPDWGGAPDGQSVAIKCGHNYNEGYVARWKDISPDSGGNIVIQCHGVAYSSSDPANKGYLNGIIITEQAGVTYQEFNRTAQGSGVVTESDLQIMKELNKTVSATGVVSCNDVLVLAEMNRTVAGSGVVSCFDTYVYVEADRMVTVVGVIISSDRSDMKDLNRTVVADTVISCEDEQTGTVQELDRTAVAEGVVTCLDKLFAVDLNKTVIANVVVSKTDEQIMEERSFNKVINGDFINWTATDPDNWDVTEGGGSEVSEVGQGEGYGGSGTGFCNLYSSIGLPVVIWQIIPIVVGKKYAVDILVDTIITNGIRVWDNDGTPEFTQKEYTTVGYKGFIFTATGDHVDLSIQAAGATNCDVTIDNVSIQAVIPADVVVVCSDDYIMGELGRTVSAAGVVSCNDKIIAAETSKIVIATGGVSDFDLQEMKELGLIVSADGVVFCLDEIFGVMQEFNRTVFAVGVASCSDTLIGLDVGSVSANAIVTESEVGIWRELGLTIIADGILSETEILVYGEIDRIVMASGIANDVDEAVFLESDRTAVGLGVVTETDITIGTEALNIQADAILLKTDVVVLSESLTVTVDTMVSCIDTLGGAYVVAAFVILRQCTS